MKNTTFILIISLTISVFCIISICVAPVINNLLDKFTNWGKLNCEYYSDIAEYSSQLNTHFENQKLEKLCRRQNAMYGLEYSAFIINLVLAASLAQLSLMHFFDKGSTFEKTTGLIGFIGGIVTFLLMLVYVCFSGYIFTRDVAFKDVTSLEPYSQAITRLYPNGANKRNIGDSTFVTIYEKDKTDDSQYVKYKDLGDSQYNYNKKYYETYYYTQKNGGGNCISISSSSCDYIYSAPYGDNKNKYLYNRWCLSLVLAVFIVILNAVISIFGFFIYRGGENGETKVISII